MAEDMVLIDSLTNDNNNLMEAITKKEEELLKLKEELENYKEDSENMIKIK